MRLHGALQQNKEALGCVSMPEVETRLRTLFYSPVALQTRLLLHLLSEVALEVEERRQCYLSFPLHCDVVSSLHSVEGDKWKKSYDLTRKKNLLSLNQTWPLSLLPGEQPMDGCSITFTAPVLTHSGAGTQGTRLDSWQTRAVRSRQRLLSSASSTMRPSAVAGATSIDRHGREAMDPLVPGAVHHPANGGRSPKAPAIARSRGEEGTGKENSSAWLPPGARGAGPGPAQSPARHRRGAAGSVRGAQRCE